MSTRNLWDKGPVPVSHEKSRRRFCVCGDATDAEPFSRLFYQIPFYCDTVQRDGMYAAQEKTEFSESKDGTRNLSPCPIR